MCGILGQLTFKALGLADPLHQKSQFDKGNINWTRVCHWVVLGYWLINQKSTVRDLASVA